MCHNKNTTGEEGSWKPLHNIHLPRRNSDANSGFFFFFFSAVIGPLLDEGLRMTFPLCPVLCFPDPVRSGHLSDVVHSPCLLSSFSSYSVSGIPIGHTLRPTSIVLTCHMPAQLHFNLAADSNTSFTPVCCLWFLLASKSILRRNFDYR